MSADVFVDTNVLVYAYDRSEVAKQEIALAVLDNLMDSTRGAISTQVLAELYNALTKRIAVPFEPADAAEHIRNLARAWVVYSVSPEIVVAAVNAATRWKMSYWDAQIWATASMNGAQVLLSEDMRTGSVLQGVRITSPFVRGFSVSAMLSELPHANA